MVQQIATSASVTIFDTEKYRTEIFDENTELGAEWADKPHRIVYDLCDEIERLQLMLLDLGHPEALSNSVARPIGWETVKNRLDKIRVRFLNSSQKTGE